MNLDPTQFAIDANGVKLFAPWIVALGVKKDEDKDGFVELKVVGVNTDTEHHHLRGTLL